MKKLFIALTTLLLLSPIFNQTFAQSTQHVEGSTYVVDGAKVHYHYSQIVGQLYEFNVSMPNSYWTEPEREYPVIYVLDGQWDFTIVKDIVGKINYDGMIPDVITVAITWGGHDDDANQLRRRDFVPTAFPFIPDSGGASTFLEALETELIPYINSIYRNNQTSVLMGSSFGGLFTSYVMFEKPELFDGYVAMAAPYGLESEYFFGMLEQTRDSNYLQDIRAYFGVGSLDANFIDVQTFVSYLGGGGYMGLDIESDVIDNMGHSGASIVGYARGLEYIFRRPELNLPEGLLTRYVGTYSSDLGEDFPQITIEVVDNQLILNIPNQPSQWFIAESETRFYVKGINISLEFSETENGWSMVLNSQNNYFPFTKVAEGN